MSVHQFRLPQNSAPTRERAWRAAACAVVRNLWELVLLEDPGAAAAVCTAEQYVVREADEQHLEQARIAATHPSDRTGWFSQRFINVGHMEQARRFATRAACRATCHESAERGLEDAIFSASVALASRDHHGSPQAEILGELLSMQRRSGGWKRVFRLTWEDHLDWVEALRTRYEAALTALAIERTSHGDVRVADEHTPIPLPQSDSLLLFGWGVLLTFSPAPFLTLSDADDLLALAVAHPELDRLWRRCPRDDWRAWLLGVADAWKLVETDRNPDRPFASIDHELLSTRREEVWYAIDPRADRLRVESVWCLFRNRLPRPGGLIH